MYQIYMCVCVCIRYIDVCVCMYQIYKCVCVCIRYINKVIACVYGQRKPMCVCVCVCVHVYTHKSDFTFRGSLSGF